MRSFSLACLFLSITLTSATENWPQFRGPNGANHAQATNLPERWSEKENIGWKVAIHDRGWSSPVIWGNQIWMTTARADGKELFAVAVDKETGRMLHDIKVFDVEKPAFRHAMNSYASCTPVIEEGRVYVHFGSYGTACLDTATGKVLWQRRDLPCDHFRGPGSSPILHGNGLYIAFDGFDYQYVVGLNKQTGQTLWRTDRAVDFKTDDGDFKKAYGTPSVQRIGGKDYIVISGAMATMAYDPEMGKELWRVRNGGINVTSPPLAGHGMLFLSTGYSGLRLLAIRPEGQGDITDTNIVWKFSRNVPTRSSPVLVGDLLYMMNDNGIGVCVDAKTGTQVWQHRFGGQFSASPLFADGRIYCCDQDGKTYVLAPGRELKILATNQLDEGCMATPCAVGSALYVRTTTHLYRIEKR
jgi:outer membrane protein assembly factor BamB